jgi:YidC/Oxa1 family membrane protein insertase
VDKRTIIGFIIIGLIIILYPMYMKWIAGGKGVQKAPPRPQTEVDTLKQPALPVEEGKEISPKEAEFKTAGLTVEDTLAMEKTVRVETELYTAEFSTRGGVLESFTLKKYQYWEGGEIQLLPQDRIQPALNVIFPDSSVSLEMFNFRVDTDQLVLDQRHPTGSIDFTLTTQSGVQIIKKYDFFNGRYDFKLELEINGSNQLDLGRKYLLGWASGLASTEKDRKGDLVKFTGGHPHQIFPGGFGPHFP